MYELKVSLCSSLEKVFSHDEILPAALQSVSLMRGQKAAFQVVVKSELDEKVTVGVVSPFETEVFKVTEIPSAFPMYEDRGNTVVVNGAKPGSYPDLLMPCDGTALKKADENAVFWVELKGGDLSAEEYTVNVVASTAETAKNVTLPVRLYSPRVQKQTLRHINWFHTDCLATYYKTEVFSEKYWEITENFARNAFEHGVSVLFTPLFTPPLDTAEGAERPTVQLVGVTKKRQEYEFDFTLLDRWIDMAHRIGFEYFELSHLFTQWGAKHAPKIIAKTIQGERKIFGWETKSDSDEYENFLRQFGAALTEYTDGRGITDKCYIHCSDEPGVNDIFKYRKAAKIIHDYFGAHRHIDALSDYSFYKLGLIDLPVPEEGSIDKFAGKVPELWTYYCCGQFKDNLPNRMFALPSVKNRILGTLLYKYDCAGFLQWGFNFYYTQLSKAEINPFEVTDAGGAFPSGDAFIVYPGEGGMPLSSIRQKVFYEGIRDYEALRQLEKLTSREYVLEMISESLGDIRFTSYPLDPDRLLSFADRIYARIEEAEK